MRNRINLIAVFILCFLVAPGMLQAQTAPAEKNVLFVIGNLNAAIRSPIQKYMIDEDQLYLIDEFSINTHELGPVGLAVDEANELFFVSFEMYETIKVFSTEDGIETGSITELGVTDFAGIAVHQGRGHLYAVDRRQNIVYVYDTTTLNKLEQWTISEEAWGIDIVGNYLYVTDSSSTVNWYDIDTHAKAGSMTQTFGAVGIAVTDYPDLTIFTQDWFINDPNDTDFRKYDVQSGTQSSVLVGDATKGLSLNPAAGYGYSITDNKIHVIDLETMAIVNTETLTWTWTPTDCLAANLDMTGKIIKTSPSHPDGNIYKGDMVDFVIKVQNVNSEVIHQVAISDQYDTTQLEFVSATPAPDDNVDDGVVDWSDLITQLGHDLAVGETAEIEVRFLATEDCGEELELFGFNVASMSNVYDDQGNSLPGDDYTFDYTIDCSCRTNSDCDDGIGCNGVEICQPDGSCSDPDDLCEDGEHCNVTLDRCLPSAGLQNFWF